MTLKRYLILISLTTAICWTTFLFVASVINPELTSWLGFFLFYISLFLSLTGTASLIGFLVRFVALRRELAFYAVRNAYRQSFLFALFIVAILAMMSQGLFTWLNLGILVTLFIIIEAILTRPSKTRV